MKNLSKILTVLVFVFPLDGRLIVLPVDGRVTVAGGRLTVLELSVRPTLLYSSFELVFVEALDSVPEGVLTCSVVVPVTV